MKEKSSYMQSVRSEFSKITWPGTRELKAKSVMVVASATALGAGIAMLDYVFKFGLDQLLSLIG